MERLLRLSADVSKTLASLVGAFIDWLVLRTAIGQFIHSKFGQKYQFAFLVHPRTDELEDSDVYGDNDIYRPYPFFRHLFPILGKEKAEKIIRDYAKKVVPITLSTIKVDYKGVKLRGMLLSTVRTPEQLLRGGKNTRIHLADLYRLASRKGARRVGLGALLPSMTRYGEDLVQVSANTGISTGHAYTGYVIVEFLRYIMSCRELGDRVPVVAVVGAAGSTGRATLKMLEKTEPLVHNYNLHLVDVPAKKQTLSALADEIKVEGCCVQVYTDLESLAVCDYVIVVTAAKGAIIRPGHIRPGTVIIDDSQPRNTSPELVQSGAFVVDVLARINGLDCGFDFGFKANNLKDTSVTFTCAAEAILASLAECWEDLAIGEVTDDVVSKTLSIIAKGKQQGVIGTLPLYSFGREIPSADQQLLLSSSSRPDPNKILLAGE